jgi:hypothetical protein
MVSPGAPNPNRRAAASPRVYENRYFHGLFWLVGPKIAAGRQLALHPACIWLKAQAFMMGVGRQARVLVRF